MERAGAWRRRPYAAMVWEETVFDALAWIETPLGLSR